MATERPKNRVVPQLPASNRTLDAEPHRPTPYSSAGFYCPTFNATAAREIVLADADDLAFIVHLQKRFSNEVGFLPRQAIEWYLDNRCVFAAVENGQPAGYVLGRPSLRWNRAIRPLTQCAICYDLQRRHAGLALVRRVEDAARQAGQQALQAMCREDLDANHFWTAAGFIEIGRLAPQNTRQKEIICWRKPLVINPHPWLFQMPPVAGHRAKRVSRPFQPLLFNINPEDL